MNDKQSYLSYENSFGFKTTVIAKNYRRKLFIKLKHFVNFCTHYYIPWYINCTIVSTAPCNHLGSSKKIQDYKTTDELCVTSALLAMNRHLWYIVEELFSLSLVDKKTSLSVKSKITDALNQKLACKPNSAFKVENCSLQGTF